MDQNDYKSPTWTDYTPKCYECCDNGRIVYNDSSGALCVKPCPSCKPSYSATPKTPVTEKKEVPKSWFDTDKDFEDL